MARMEGGLGANVLLLFGRILPPRAAWDGELFAFPGGLYGRNGICHGREVTCARR